MLFISFARTEMFYFSHLLSGLIDEREKEGERTRCCVCILHSRIRYACRDTWRRTLFSRNNRKALSLFYFFVHKFFSSKLPISNDYLSTSRFHAAKLLAREMICYQSENTQFLYQRMMSGKDNYSSHFTN